MAEAKRTMNNNCSKGKKCFVVRFTSSSREGEIAMFILCVIIIIAVICIAIIRYHSDKEVDEVNKYIDWIEKTYHFEANFRLLRKEYPHLKLLPIEPLDIRRLNTYDPQRNEIYYDSRARRATRRPDQEQPHSTRT